MALRIRCRERRCASPKPGLKSSWDEWQVVEYRKILSRHDTEAQARAWCDWHRHGQPVEVIR